MNRRQAGIALAGSAVAVAGAALAQRALLQLRLARAKPPALLIGSAAAMLSLNEALARAFVQRHPEFNVVVEQGGSLPSYIAASRKAIDLAGMTRALSDAEDDTSARNYLIAKGDFGIIVNRASPLVNLAQEQIRALLTGEIANWTPVGGGDQPVRVCTRARGSITRTFAEEVLLDGSDFANGADEFDSDAALTAAVALDPHAIGYLAGDVRDDKAAVVCLAVDGVSPSRGTVLSGRYPFTQSFHLMLYGEQHGGRAEFLRFARSPAGQAIVAQQGLIPVF